MSDQPPPSRVLRSQRVLQPIEGDEMPLDKWHWDHIRGELESLEKKWGGQATVFLDLCFVCLGGLITVIFVLLSFGDEANPDFAEVVVAWMGFGVFLVGTCGFFGAHRSKTKDRKNEVRAICEYMGKVESRYEAKTRDGAKASQ